MYLEVDDGRLLAVGPLSSLPRRLGSKKAWRSEEHARAKAKLLKEKGPLGLLAAQV